MLEYHVEDLQRLEFHEGMWVGEQIAADPQKSLIGLWGRHWGSV